MGLTTVQRYCAACDWRVEAEGSQLRSETVRYTANMEISDKWFVVPGLLLQTTSHVLHGQSNSAISDYLK